MGADLLLVDGNIHTLDSRHPIANAIAFAGGRIAALDGEALEARDARTNVIDLRGRTAIPGLTDHHVHFTAYAKSLSYVKLRGVRSLAEAVGRVAARVASAAPAAGYRRLYEACATSLGTAHRTGEAGRAQ